MTTSAVRVGVGTHFAYDGEVVKVVELIATPAGNEVLLKGTRDQRVRRVALKELLYSSEARVLPEDPGADDDSEPAGVVLAELTEEERAQLLVRGEHVREVLTGYRSGHAELAREDEPRPQFDPRLPLESRYAAKAAELSVTDRTVKRWVRTYRQHGVAGLVDKHLGQPTKVDSRWVETAIEVMVEHTDQSRPSPTMVINRTNARVVARFGEGVVRQPSRSTAYRVLHDLEKRYPDISVEHQEQP